MDTVVGRSIVSRFEWQTAILIVVSYLAWISLLVFGSVIPTTIWIVLSALNLTFFMSITHEVVHGHPTRNALLNRLLILFPIAFSIPYERFRDTHFDHHETDELTDPFDDPESWYLAKYDWVQRYAVTRGLFEFNNTLFGRMLVGPIISLGRFYAAEAGIIRHNLSGQRNYLLSVWALHFALCGLMILLVTSISTLPLWQWLVAVYLGHSVLLIRTFLEHQAAPDQSERTVIIEMACPIAFLFLFNNYHFVHHQKPHVPWYKLPTEYRRQRDHYVQENGAYVYRSYVEIIGRYFFRTKEPVFHPFLRHEA